MRVPSGATAPVTLPKTVGQYADRASRTTSAAASAADRPACTCGWPSTRTLFGVA